MKEYLKKKHNWMISSGDFEAKNVYDEEFKYYFDMEMRRNKITNLILVSLSVILTAVVLFLVVSI